MYNCKYGYRPDIVVSDVYTVQNCRLGIYFPHKTTTYILPSGDYETPLSDLNMKYSQTILGHAFYT